MTTSPEIPKYAWQRRLDEVLDMPGHPKSLPFDEILAMLPLIIRLRRNVRQERKAGRTPAIDPFQTVDPGPYQGVPLGGIGGGAITRGWRGDFGRWQMQPGMIHYGPVPADQFSVYVERRGKRPVMQVLFGGDSDDMGGALRGWAWGLSGKKSTYHALYPRAWTVYKEPDPDLTMTCRQVSPIIPHNYNESSTPAGVFVWTLENTGKQPVTVALMFTFQNGTGSENDRAGGHSNTSFRLDAKGGEVVGVALRHIHRQPKPLAEDQKLEEQEQFEDPLTFAIAAQASKGVEVTYRSRFVSTSSGMDVWGDLRADGKLENVDDEKPSPVGMAIGAALCATVEVPPGETRQVVFSLAWDMPLARFGAGTAYYRRYTRTYGRDGDAAPAIARDAILNYPDWERQIEKWQKPILEDDDPPDWYKTALFNELYYITDGGTVWTDGAEGEEPPPKDDIGHFAYLEGLEYRMYNTYDVHFYASFALAMLWPELELSLQRDFAHALNVEHPEERRMQGTGKFALRKVQGSIPHDLGGPTEDPWNMVNLYSLQDVSRWKDLNPKFVLQVYRDYVATGDKQFLKDVWDAVMDAIDYVAEFDIDEDGLIDNEGFPDQTYDTWSVSGPGAYCAGLWLACLSAAAAMADVVGDKSQAKTYRKMLEKGQEAFEEQLWNGEYYDYDGSGSAYSNSIMADQMAGQWYARACGLPPIVPEEHARSALNTVFEFNVKRFENGEMGAVNGMRPDGKVDATSMQSQEVWTGVTYAVAAAMLQEGLKREAYKTAQGIYKMTYHELGYWFQTPEAWDYMGDFRSLAYMRPLAIWAMQWAREKVMK